MNFFNIGVGEFFLVVILAMIVFGPQRLPELFRRLGKALRDLREFARNIDPELLKDFREITQDIESVRSEMSTLRDDLVGIQRDLAGAAKEVTDGVNEAVRGAADVQQAIASTSSALAAMPTGLLSGNAADTAAPFIATHSIASQPSAGGPLTTARAITSSGTVAATPAPTAASATANMDFQSEIVGRPLPVRGPGDGSYLDEIVGAKTFPLPHRAAYARGAEFRNGHDRQPVERTRDAVMVALARRHPAPALPGATRRAPVQPRPARGARQAAPTAPRRMRRG